MLQFVKNFACRPTLQADEFWETAMVVVSHGHSFGPLFDGMARRQKT